MLTFAEIFLHALACIGIYMFMNVHSTLSRLLMRSGAIEKEVLLLYLDEQEDDPLHAA